MLRLLFIFPKNKNAADQNFYSVLKGLLVKNYRMSHSLV